MRNIEERSQPDILSRELRIAFATLLKAYAFAADTGSDLWDFAVSSRELCECGLCESHFRWLVRKGYVEHAREVTVEGDDGREFRPTGNLMFRPRTCFVLTLSGVAKAHTLAGFSIVEQSKPTLRPTLLARNNGKSEARPIVHWDADCRKLRVDGILVKRFKWPAVNQEAVLNAFQEEGWPERIDDPLPPEPEQDPKRRLSDTIKCLNRKQVKQLIRFHGDGTGEGVVWELAKLNSEVNEAGNRHV